MVRGESEDKHVGRAQRERRESVGHMILRAANQLLGGSTVTTPERRDGEGSNGEADAAAKRSAEEAKAAAEKLESTLRHFESMMQTLEQQLQDDVPQGDGASHGDGASQRDAAQHDVLAGGPDEIETHALQDQMQDFFERLDAAVERLNVQTARLSDGASDLAVVAGRVEALVSDVTRALGHASRMEEDRSAQETESLAPVESQFQPGEVAVGVVLAAVPGFQGLMDAQRVLTNLPEAEGASVVAYKNGEASLEMVLRQPVTASRIVEGLSESVGQPVLIEESRPESLRLRLRFVDRNGATTA